MRSARDLRRRRWRSAHDGAGVPRRSRDASSSNARSGAAASGIVYRAMDEVTGQPVALKVIALPGVDAGEEARFRREGRVLAGLHHPGIVRVVAFGQLDDGQPYVAMEWLEGEDIAQRQRRSPLAARPVPRGRGRGRRGAGRGARRRASCIATSSRRTCSSSEARRPMTSPSQVKLVDFGVASAEDAKLTRTGAIVGTPAYMAPEQARGDGEVDARADLYALGATLFEMIAGRPPHVGPTPIAILARLVTTPAPRLVGGLRRRARAARRARWRACSRRPRASGRRPRRDVARELRGDRRRARRSRRDATSSPGATRATSASRAARRPTRRGGTRLVTSIVATHVPKGAPRARLLAHLRARGADATELGGDAIVAHLGVRKTRSATRPRARSISGFASRRSTRASASRRGARASTGRARPGEVVDRAAALARDAARGQVLADTTTTELARGRFELQLRGDGSAVVGHAGARAARDRAAARRSSGARPSSRRSSRVRALRRRPHADHRDASRARPGIGKTRLRREALSRIASHAERAARSCSCAASRSRRATRSASWPTSRAGSPASPKGAALEEALDATDVLIAVSDVPCSDAARELVARLVANEPLPERRRPRGARDALWLALTDMAVGMARHNPLVVVARGRAVGRRRDPRVDRSPARARGRAPGLRPRDRAADVLARRSRALRGSRSRAHRAPAARAQARRERSRAAILGERATGERGEALVDSIAQQAGGLAALRRGARAPRRRRAATPRTRRRSRRRCRCTSTRSTTRRATRPSKLAVFGLDGLGRRARGARRGRTRPRRCASSRRPRSSSSRRTSRFTGHARVRVQARAHARGRVRVARRGRSSSELPRARRALAREDGRGRRDRRAAPRARRRRDRGGRGYLEKAARRALAANALAEAVSLAEKALAFAEDKPTQFARAQLLDEAWSRLDARAGERDTAVRAMQDAVYDEASEVRARARASATRTRAAAAPTRARASTRCAARRRRPGSPTKRRAARAALAARYAFAGELDAGRRASPTRSSTLVAAARHPGRGGRRLADARRRAADARRGGRGARSAPERGARGERRAAQDARGDAHDQRRLRAHDGRRAGRGAPRDRERHRARAGHRLAGRRASRPDEPALLGGDVRRATPRSTRPLAETRAVADAAARGQLGPARSRDARRPLLPRRASCLRARRAARRDARDAPADSRRRVTARRRCSTSLPVALGLWAEAERRCGDAETRAIARERGRGAARRRVAEPAQRSAGLPRAPRRVRRPRPARRGEAGDRARRPAARDAREGPRGDAVRARVPHAARAERGAPRRGRGVRPRPRRDEHRARRRGGLGRHARG